MAFEHINQVKSLLGRRRLRQLMRRSDRHAWLYLSGHLIFLSVTGCLVAVASGSSHTLGVEVQRVVLRSVHVVLSAIGIVVDTQRFPRGFAAGRYARNKSRNCRSSQKAPSVVFVIYHHGLSIVDPITQLHSWRK